nr:probable cytochrome P450 305a1 isoform X1 [Megalopta genalis]XP_033340661.1 probable cytochrome P450 305a1 isoform X2 [Megalopta genalis]XP_033340662.1 probable cytochrome P450 305a1 isoform X1 [Megalopta genalis]
MVATVILVLLIVIFMLFSTFTRLKMENHPPGPFSWPIIGNQFLLNQLCVKYGGLHLATIELCKQYRSDAITLYLGMNKMVVVSGVKLVTAVINRGEFEGRPFDEFIKIRTFGKKQGITMNDGPAWKELSSWMIHTLTDFGYGKRPMIDMITDELDAILENLKGGGVRTLKPIVAPATLNVLWQFTMGKHFNMGPRLEYFIDMMDRRSRMFDVTGGALSSFPWLRYVAPEASGYKLLVTLNDELKNFFMETLMEHKKNYVPGKVTDIIDKFMSEMMKNRADDTVYTEDQLMVILMDFFIAAFTTTATVLEFLFLYMIIHQDVQRKLQKEIDSAIPPDRLPDTADRLKLPYAEAIISETMRMWPVFPLIGPRRVLCDTELGNYRIPKETTILINNYSVNRDPELYPEPDKFKPERHIKNGAYEPDMNSIIFGKGRRKCPGAILAKTATFVIFVGVMQRFTLLPVPGKEPKSIEIIPGLAITPKPYDVLLVPR